mmetsp:Transcript_110595/g.323621  ORF Transcript_110595/g.323621 Transcript_110595/m.323621 type:complete len:201 (+) Transcript_110595:955-1557(+)
MKDGRLDIFCNLPFFLPLLKRPPQKKDIPSTSSRLDRTEPRSEHFTTSMKPARRVCIIMTTSTAFPKVAFRRPANMSFLSPAASSSVASPKIFARGTRATKLSPKVGTSPHLRKFDTIPRGKHISKHDNGCLSMESTPDPSTFGGLGWEVPLTKRDALDLRPSPMRGVSSGCPEATVDVLAPSMAGRAQGTRGARQSCDA